MLGKHLRRRRVGKRPAKPHPLAHLGDNPPVGPCLAGYRQKCALTRDAALRIGDRAVLLAPGGSGQSDMGVADGVGLGQHVRHHDERAGLDRRFDGIGIRHRIDRVGGHDPQRLDAPIGDRLEHLDRLQAGPLRYIRRLPEALYALAMVGVFDLHMGGEHVGHAADLAAAHGVGLAGHGERPCPGLADAASGEMAVDDGVDLVGARRRLVHPLAVDGHRLRRRGEQAVEAAKLVLAQARGSGDAGKVERGGGEKRLSEAGRVSRDVGAVKRVVLAEPGEQPGEQSDVAIRRDRQVHVGDVSGHGATRVDQHDLHLRPLFPGRGDALVEHGMAPGEVGADQHDQVGKLQVIIGSRYGVGAEGAAVAGDRGSHAQARIGVDVGRADKTLHQLVGDVIILGQQLAGDIEGDRIRAVLGDGLREGRGDEVERLVPAGAAAVDLGMEQPAVEVDGLGQCRALGAEPAEIGRMVGVAADGHLPVRGDLRQHAAAHPAIGAGGPHLARCVDLHGVRPRGWPALPAQ